MPKFLYYPQRLKIILLCLLSLSVSPAYSKKSSSLNDPSSQKSPLSSFKMDFNVEKFKLDNGLTVLLHVDSKAPLINYQTWYQVGSKDDPPRQTGMAHLFEHLMFRGTHKREGKEFVQEIHSKGISFNAYTSFDETVYHFDLPKKELNFIAELEAERMHDLNLNAKNVQLEQEIVKEERLMRYKNKPQNIWADLTPLTFKKNNYRWPTIGHPKDINRITSEDCQKFYKTFYAPNNAVIVISGPIHIGKTKSIIKKHYGSIPASSLTPVKYPVEPLPTQPRIKNLYRKVQAPSITLAYHTPGAGSKDVYALDVLSFILGGGQSSRLYQTLVEKEEKSLSIYAHNMTFTHAGLLLIRSSLHPNTNLNQAYKSIMAEIKKLTEQPIEQEELDRAKTNLIKSHIDALKTASGKASLLGNYETTFGDYKYLFGELEKYFIVSAQDVIQVAKKFLKPNQQTRIKLYPKK